MKMDQIRAIAQTHGIKTGRLKKADLVRAIQQAEGNRACFATGQRTDCGQTGCLWWEDCD